MRLLGIPTVIDRMVQQAINQTLTPIYERQFPREALASVREEDATTPCEERRNNRCRLRVCG